jgi:predicted component of type VI protein secretion system
MKLSLVVAQGVHTGKVIPITTPEFIIGRDPQCQLRPASPAVSKQHCAVAVRDGKVFVRDCGSTNGTFVNGEQVAADREVKSGDRLRVGPLEFDVKFEVGAPAAKPAAAPAQAMPALKPAPAPAQAKKAPAKAAVAAAIATDTVPEGGTVIMTAGVPTDDRSASTTIVDAPGSNLDDDPDHAAALLLGLDDGPSSTTPTVEQFSADPTTVMEMPALGNKPGEPKKEEKKAVTDSANAAAEALSKYMRRPRT